jgi:hypothetical protein
MTTNDSDTLCPAEVVADDPGDETARRYRFQYTWAAIVCCALLDETSDVVEVFCEHHEDVLVKHSDGRFSGQQIKTRESDQPVWKAGEEQVRSAFARFVKLDAQFPGHFRTFHFLTNHPLFVAENARSIGFVLSKIREAPTVADLPSNVGSWLQRVSREAEESEAAAFQTLKKCTSKDQLPKLQDSLMRLMDVLVGCWPGAAYCSLDCVRRSAQALIEECARASALDHQQLLPAYVAATESPEQELATRIKGKRIGRIRVLAILDEGITATAPLTGEPSKWVEPGNGSTELMLKKLDAGGFSAVSCNSAENLRDKADYLAIAWTKKLGRSKGLERYDHVRSIALSDAGRAFDATKVDGRQFGPAMREDLCARFQARRVQGQQLFDCSNEHLEGFAYSLTSQCKVQWSIDRPWEKK